MIKDEAKAEQIDRQQAVECLRSAYQRVLRAKAGKPTREGPLKLIWDVINAVPAALYHLDGTPQFEADLEAERICDDIDSHRLAEREAIVAWLRSENASCDCFARSDTECACGAWDDYKTKPLSEIADAIESGQYLQGESRRDSPK